MKFNLVALMISLSTASVLLAPLKRNSLLPLLERQGTALRTCAIIGEEDAECYESVHTSSPVVTILTLGLSYDFDCICTGGEEIDENSGWDYNPTSKCYVHQLLTDANCPQYGRNALPLCAKCPTDDKHSV